MEVRRVRTAARAAVAVAVVVSALSIGAGGNGSPGVRDQALAIQARLIEVIERVKPTVVAVFRGGANNPATGSGSGVLIDKEGYALTNYHVVGQSTDVRCGLPDGHIYPAKVVGRDPTGDIALIKLSRKEGAPSQDFPAATLGDSDDLEPGEWGIAMGNPFNLATDFQPTMTLGIISGLNRYLAGQEDNTLIYTNCIQIDTSINPGNSGGPLFNSTGELIGINGRIAGRPDRGRVNVGAGFAISINQIKRFIPTMKAGRDVYHAQLGVRVDTNESGGVKVVEVVQDSAAGDAGIKPGDVILKFNGEPILGRQHLVNMIGVLPAGTEAVVRLARGGKEEDRHIELGGLPAGAGVLAGKGRGKTVVQHTPFAMPDQAPSVDDVLGEYVKALGGRAVIDAVPGTKATAEAVVYGPQRLTAAAVFYGKRPDKSRSEIEIHQARAPMPAPATSRASTSRAASRPVQVIREIRGFDGAAGWVSGPRGGVQAMPGNELEDLRRDILEERILRLAERPADITLAYLGQSLIGETRTHVIYAKGERIGGRWWFFDVNTHLLVRTRYQSLSRGLWTVEDLADYRPVQGMQIPFHAEDYAGGALWADVVMKSITVEKDLKDALFKAP